MAQVSVYNLQGEVVKSIELTSTVFNVEPRKDLMHTVVVAQLADRRAGSACTKTRSDIHGSTRKLFRQKGTGNARRGSIKSPLLRGGGTVFGPLPRSYSQRIPKKVRRAALASALSQRLADKALYLVESISFETPRTKSVIELANALNLSPNGLLVVTGTSDESFDAVRKSVNNLPRSKSLKCLGVNVYDSLKAKAIIMTEAAALELEARFNSYE